MKKTILLIGATGVGKSLIGNALLQENVFDSSAGAMSKTWCITGHTKTIRLPEDAGQSQLQLEVVDTPGIGDTEGKSTEYLDAIIKYIREHDINMIVIVNLQGRFSPAEKRYILALKQCLQRFDDATTALIINKVPRLTTLKRNKAGPQTIEECVNECKKSICKELKIDDLANVVSIPNDADDDELKIIAEQMWYYATKSNEINKACLSTWSERLAHYTRIRDGKMSVSEGVQSAVNALEQQRIRCEIDIAYQQDKLNGITSYCADTWATRVFRPNDVARGRERNRCLDAIARRRQEISNIQESLNAMKNQTDSARQLLKQAEEELHEMQLIFK